MTQYGFFIDLSRCIGCNACVIACKQWHDLKPGPTKWMRVYQWENGSFPDIEVHTLPIPCFHCQDPVCADACPNQAITKEKKWGAVLVDQSKCTGHRKCFEACPYGVPQFETDKPDQIMSKCNMCVDRLEKGLNPICVLSCSMRALEFGPIEEIKKKYGDQALPFGMSEGNAPCKIACPAGVDAEGYIKYIAEGKLKEALALFRQSSPLAGVLGRVCTHPCEVNCQRGKFDEAIPVCSLKRYMADAELEVGRDKAARAKITRKEKVAVIGSGPAGLTCALDLTHMGYPVTIFESAAEAGGQMRYGIPQYRLPKDILSDEISYIQEHGIEIKTNSPVKKLEDLTSQGFKAVFIATGAWQSLKLNVPGEDAKGVISALDFLTSVNSGVKVTPGKKVIVIGGGSVAVDAARVARRLGAKEVHIVCLECRDLASKDRMLAQNREIQEAEEEGVMIHPSLGIQEILVKDGKAIGIETMTCFSVREADGSFNPKYDKTCSALDLKADSVIVAIGQTAGKPVEASGLQYARSGSLKVDRLTLQTSLPAVFAGGDMISGAADIISAVAAGKEAAISIDRYLRGKDLREGRKAPVKSLKEPVNLHTIRPPVIPASRRKAFAEVAGRLDKETAMEQAQKCLHCGVLVPSAVFKPEDPKRQILPYDAKKALELWQKRHPDNGEALPDVFENAEDVTHVPEEMIGRNRLVLKPKNTEEQMFYTTDEE